MVLVINEESVSGITIFQKGPSCASGGRCSDHSRTLPVFTSPATMRRRCSVRLTSWELLFSTSIGLLCHHLLAHVHHEALSSARAESAFCSPRRCDVWRRDSQAARKLA